MKIFIYKVIIVIFSVYLLFQFTVGRKIEMYETKIETLGNKNEREKIIDKIKDEIQKANDKENLFTPEERKLLSTFFKKVRKELESNQSQKLLIFSILMSIKINIIHKFKFTLWYISKKNPILGFPIKILGKISTINFMKNYKNKLKRKESKVLPDDRYERNLKIPGVIGIVLTIIFGLMIIYKYQIIG